MGRFLTVEEFSRYADLAETNPATLLQLQLFEIRHRDAFDQAVEDEVGSKLPSAIEETLEELIQEIDDLEENILSAMKNASYESLSDRVGELFMKLRQKQIFAGKLMGK